MVKVAASLDSRHLRMELRCNIALEMAHDMIRNAHIHREGGDMLCVGEIHGIVATIVWQMMMGRMRDQSMQG